MEINESKNVALELMDALASKNQVYNIIGFEHHFLIVLYYNNRIPHIP